MAFIGLRSMESRYPNENCARRDLRVGRRAFGGPTRVAFGQAKALAERGHDVTVFAGSPPSEAGETLRDGFRIRTFPIQRVAPFGGFATLRPRGMHAALTAQANELDVAHVHLARDLATLPAALALRKLGVPYVTQTHGMIDRSDKRLAAILDRLATGRCARRRPRVGYCSPQRKRRNLPTSHSGPYARGAKRRGTAGDDSLDQRNDTVLFLARLHERKRPIAFVEMAKRLADDLPHTQFLLIGPDEGEGAAVARAISTSGLGDRLRWAGALSPDETASAMQSARVYVLPAVNEVFPMTILESFVAGTPVVTTSSLGIAPECERFGAALITDGTTEQLAAAVLRHVTTTISLPSLRHGLPPTSKRNWISRTLLATSKTSTPTSWRLAVTEVCIVQPYLPRYRVPFFDGLSVTLKEHGVDLRVIAGQAAREQAQRGDSAQGPWLEQVRTRTLAIGSRHLALTRTSRLWKYSDAVIVPHQGSSLDALAAMRLEPAPRGRVGAHRLLHLAAQSARRRCGALAAPARAPRLRLYARWCCVRSPTGSALGAHHDGYEHHRHTRLDAALARTTPTDIAAFRQRHECPTPPTWRTWEGLDRSKRIDVLAQSLEILHARRSNVHIVVAGRGDQEHLLRPRRHAGQVTLVGYADVDTKALILKGSEAIANPGRVGLIAVDALTARRSIVTTRWPWHAPEIEYLRVGESMVLSPDNAGDFADALEAAGQRTGFSSSNDGRRRRAWRPWCPISAMASLRC